VYVPHKQRKLYTRQDMRENALTTTLQNVSNATTHKTYKHVTTHKPS